MKTTFNITKDKKVKSIDIHATPIEFMIIKDGIAALAYMAKNETDKQVVQRMLKEIKKDLKKYETDN